MDHAERGRRQELHDEIAVAHGVDRVGGDAREPELRGGCLAVQGEPGARQRTRAQRAAVGPALRIDEATAVALEHLDIGQEVVREEHRLCRLSVRHPGQDRLPVTLRPLDQGSLQVPGARVDVAARAAKPEPQVERNLVVPGPPGMQPPGDRADPGGEGRLDVEVDILERRVPGEGASLDLRAERLQPGHDRVCIGLGYEGGADEAVHMGDRTRDVVGRQEAVDLERPRERCNVRIALSRETPSPEPHAAASPAAVSRSRPSAAWPPA